MNTPDKTSRPKPSKQKVLQVSSLSKRFKNVQAVDDISFSLNNGDIFAFLGPNGAGKTTTLRILLDIIRADSGSIRWNINGSETSVPPASRTGYLPEERGLYTDQPILKSLVYMAAIRGMNPRAAEAEAMIWLEKLNLADRAKDKLQVLSKGNQQKIQFVASILHKPDFAILDEPFSGLDPVNQEMFIEFIRELNAQGTTVLLSAHQMALVEKIADRIFLINDGKEVFNGTLSELYQQCSPGHILDIVFASAVSQESLASLEDAETIVRNGDRRVTVTLRGDAVLNRALEQLGRIDEIEDVKSHSVGLHDIFLSLVGRAKQ
jgi:ABC-2 type transport system ATP-binding protein